MDSPEFDFVLINEGDTAGSDQSGLQPLTVQEQLKIREWLQPTDYSADSSEYHRHLSSHVFGTTEWTQKSEYQQWISSKNQGALWIKAIAGAGKSVAAAYLASGLQQAKHVPVLHFFFRQIIESNRTPISLLRDWMSQLLEFSPFLQSKLNEYLDARRSLASVAFDELWQQFENAVCNLQRVYCFADALDEMSSGNDWFTEKLAKLGQLKPGNVKVLMTSRPLPQIESLLRHENIVKIGLGKTVVDEDIVIYIEHRLRKSQLPVDLWQDTKSGLISRSQGSFLYTKLTMDDLLNSPRYDLSDAASVREALDGMPNGLAEKYTSMLYDHSARSGVPQSLQLTILRWVTHSNRPLRLLEIAAMVDSVKKKHDLNSISQADQPRRNTKSVIRKACGPLIEILEDETVGVIHHSFTEFLIDSARKPAINGAPFFPAIDSRESHLIMALSCVNYLNSGWAHHFAVPDEDEPDSWNWDKDSDSNLAFAQYPFLNYASLYWAYHSSQFGASNDELFVALDKFLLRSPQTFALYLTLKSERADYSGDCYYEGTSAPHVAAREGLAHYAEYLICSGHDFKAENEDSETPMHCAAASGSPSIIRVLLKHGVDPDPPDESGLKPLHIAATRNHASIVRTLLEAGVNPHTSKTCENPGMRCGNAPSTKGDTPVMYAFSYGHLEAAFAFIPFLSSGAISEALNLAAKAGKMDIVLTVLDMVNVDINKVADGKTLLYLAAYRHEPCLIQKLLDLGADSSILSDREYENTRQWVVTGFDERSYTPLHALATGRSSAKIDQKSTADALRLLLASGCDIEAVDADGRTPLHLAVANRQRGYSEEEPATAFALLQDGANSSAITKQGLQPLHLARNNSQLIHALCQRGADVNAIDLQNGKTALHYAMQDTSQAKFLALVECGADCRIQDKHGDTPLHLALASNHHANLQVKALLDNAADPNVKNKAGKTPLHNLGSNQSIRSDQLRDLLAMLLSAGADLESRMPCGKTFFMESMSLQTDDSRVKLSHLLEAGCRPDTRDHEGRNVLHLLLTNTRRVESTFRALIDLKGLSPLMTDFAGNSLLHVCAPQTCWSGMRHMQENIFKLLLELGLTVAQQNNLGQTAFFIAVAAAAGSFETGDSSMLDYLSDAQWSSVVNVADRHGISPIHLSAINSERQIRLMVDKGADVFALTDDDQSALHLAARARKSNVVGFLTDLFTSRRRSDFIDHTDQRGRTALHYACRSGRIESVQILLDAGANINVFDSNNLSPLGACAEFSKYNFLGPKGKLIDVADVMRTDDHCIPKQSIQLTSYVYPRLSENDSVGVRYIVRELMARGADISHINLRMQEEFSSDESFEDVNLDGGRTIGSTTLLEELLPEIRKAEKVNGIDTSFKSPGRRQPAPYLRYLERHRCIKNDFSCEMLDELIEPGQPNSELFQTLLRHEDVRGIEKFLEFKTDLLAHEDYHESPPLSTLVKYGYAGILRTIDLDGDAKITNQLLLDACERELPNLEVLKVLVESGTFYVNSVDGQKYIHIASENVLHKLSRSPHWWQHKAIDYLVSKGANIDRQGPDGMTPLHFAVQHGFQGAIEALLRNGADSNLVADDKVSCLDCLRLVDRPQKTSIAHLLLDHGANPDLGKKPLLLDAIEAMDIDLVTRLVQIQIGPHKRYDLSAANYSRSLRSAGNGKRNTKRSRPKMTLIIQALLRAGGLPSVIPGDNISTLHDICESGGIIEPFLSFPGIDIETRDCSGRTLFIAACSHRRYFHLHQHTDRERSEEKGLTVAQELAAHGANISAVDNNSQNALDHLLHDCYDEVHAIPQYVERNFEFLLSHPSASELITNRDNSGKTPLLQAAHAGAFTFIQSLIAKGSEPNAIDNAGNSVLHLAAPHLRSDPRNFEVFAHLLSLNAPLNALNHRGESPLFLYLQTPSARMENLPFFAENDADFHTRDREGQSLLHVIAARKVNDRQVDQRKEIFEWVLGRGVDVGWEDGGERTALDVAAVAGNEGILGLFRRKD